MAINNGTISVTSGSAVITGSGTTWLTDMVGQDDYLVVDGMGFLIKSADSETKLTLLTPYTGTTGSGKAYGIVHLTGEEYVRRAAREVTDLINKYSEIKNAVSVVAGRDLIPRADASGKISKDYIDTTQENLNIQNIDANKSAINANSVRITKTESDITAHTSELATKQNKLTFDSTPVQGSSNPVTSGGVWTQGDNLYPRRPKQITQAELQKAVADESLEKHGIQVGDYWTGASGYRYVVAGLNPMRGTHGYTCVYKHCGIVVDTCQTHAWNASGNTYTGGGGRGAGYANSDLHAYLKSTVLSQINSDLGSGHLYAHQKLLTTGVNTSGYNRYGSASGCSNNWAWSEEYISALTEMQVYGSTIWSSSGYDTGEADQQLEVFRHFKHTEIFKGRYPWLRDVSSASYACGAYNGGYADNNTASAAFYVAGLILFH